MNCRIFTKRNELPNQEKRDTQQQEAKCMYTIRPFIFPLITNYGNTVIVTAREGFI